MFYLHQIKRTGDTVDKGIVVKETLDAAKQGYHAYLGAYAYDDKKDIDFVHAMVTDETGRALMNEAWSKHIPQPEPEPTPEPEPERAD